MSVQNAHRCQLTATNIYDIWHEPVKTGIQKSWFGLHVGSSAYCVVEETHRRPSLEYDWLQFSKTMLHSLALEKEGSNHLVIEHGQETVGMLELRMTHHD